MGGASARFMWDLLADRKRSEELERRHIPGTDERRKDGFSEAKVH